MTESYVQYDPMTSKTSVTLVFDRVLNEASPALMEAIINETKKAIVEHLTKQFIDIHSPEVWKKINFNTIARMAEISCGRKAIQEAIK